MSYFIIYLAGISSAFRSILFILGTIAFVVGGAAIGSCLEDKTSNFSSLKKLFPIGLLMLTLQALIPNKETLAAMAVIPPVVEYVQGSEELHKLPDNVVKFINDYIEKSNKE